MSPILVRPVREQFEHDRVIRVLQARYKRKFEVAINPGAEQNAAVSVGENNMYPDLLLYGQERGKKLQAIIEVETTESVNTLEAMAEWGPFSRLRAPLFLYVPTSTIDTVRRLCAEHQVAAAEIWTYHTAVDQVRFTLVHRAPDAAAASPTSERKARPAPARAAAGKNASPKKPAAPRKPSRPDARSAHANRSPSQRASSKARSAAKKTPKKTAKAGKRH